MKALKDRIFALTSGEVDISAIQHAWDEIVSAWNLAREARLFFDGVEKTGVALTTANTEIYHGLGRIPTRLLATKLNANATVFTDTPHVTPRTHIYVKASAAVTANLVIT